MTLEAIMAGRAKKPRTRSSAKERGTTLSVWVPVSQYDQLYKLAQRRETTVSALVKDILILRLKD